MKQIVRNTLSLQILVITPALALLLPIFAPAANAQESSSAQPVQMQVWREPNGLVSVPYPAAWQNDREGVAAMRQEMPGYLFHAIDPTTQASLTVINYPNMASPDAIIQQNIANCQQAGIQFQVQPPQKFQSGGKSGLSYPVVMSTGKEGAIVIIRLNSSYLSVSFIAPREARQTAMPVLGQILSGLQFGPVDPSQPQLQQPQGSMGGHADGGGLSDMLRLKRTPVYDPMIDNMLAGTILVPENWTLKAGMLWTWDPGNRVSLHAYVLGPQGVPGLGVYPRMTYVEPIGFFHEGQNYLGKIVRRRVTPDAYLRQFVIPLVRKDLANARVVSVNEAPNFAKLVYENSASSLPAGSNVQAVRVRFAYPLNGMPVEEDVYCSVTTSAVQMPLGRTVYWMADVESFRAEQGKLDQSMGILLMILSSIKPDLRYAVAVDQLNAQLIQNYEDQSRAALKTAMHNAANQAQITDMMRNSYNQRAAAQERTLHEFSQAIRGVETYQTSTGDRMELPNGWEHSYSDGEGNVVLTRNGPIPSSVLRSSNWQEMQKVAP